jgi:hypothetical protein
MPVPTTSAATRRTTTRRIRITVATVLQQKRALA